MNPNSASTSESGIESDKEADRIDLTIYCRNLLLIAFAAMFSTHSSIARVQDASASVAGKSDYHRGKPTYNFGDGLSYSQFAYSQLHLSSINLQAGSPDSPASI